MSTPEDEKLSKSTARIDALRIVIAKHRDELYASGERLGEPGRYLLWRKLIAQLDESLAADDAAASGVVAESATVGESGRGETRECPEPWCDGGRRWRPHSKDWGSDAGSK